MRKRKDIMNYCLQNMIRLCKTYQLAQQTRKATVVQAGLQKKAGGAFLLTSGDKKPKEPAKPVIIKLES